MGIDNNNTRPNSSLLSTNNISQKFDYELFKNICFDVNECESISIIGKSGSGKSSLLNIVSSLLKPSSGEVFYKGKSLYKLNQKELLKIRREDFGIIFQAHYLFRGFQAQENLEIATLLSNQELDKNLLKELEIEHVLAQGVGELSGGQQQRMSIARVLMKKPKIIFADEPTGNLDKDTANIVMDVLFSYIKKNKAALILVTHENDLALRCNKAYKLEDLKLEELN